MLHLIRYRGEFQFAVKYPAVGKYLVGKFLYLLDRSPGNDYLETMEPIEMDMHGRDGLGDVRMSQMNELAGQFPTLMIVNKGDYPYRMRRRVFLFLFNQTGSYEIPQRLGSVGVTFLLDCPVEIGKQAFLHRYPESNQFHQYSFQVLLSTRL